MANYKISEQNIIKKIKIESGERNSFITLA